jgi:hypothetical protein
MYYLCEGLGTYARARTRARISFIITSSYLNYI